MLDQNTDRMWFVIGALVVGAGIILLANKTMPEIFASISKSMNDTVNTSVDEIDKELIANPNIAKNTSYDWQTYSEVAANAKRIGEGWLSLEEDGLSAGDKVTFSFDYDFGNLSFKPRLNFSNVARETDDEFEIARYGDRFLTGSGHYSYTTTVPETSKYVQPLMQNSEHTDAYTNSVFKLKKVKIEKGDKETRYTP